MGIKQSNLSASSPNLPQSGAQNRRSNGTVSGAARSSSHSNSHGNSNSIYHHNHEHEDNDLSNELNQLINTPSLPIQLIPFAFNNELKCPLCSKIVLQDDAECHFVMCLTKPRISYNEDTLTENKGECVICLEDLDKGNTIARLPCLCIYHKKCIDSWFEVNRSCPEHPSD